MYFGTLHYYIPFEKVRKVYICLVIVLDKLI